MPPRNGQTVACSHCTTPVYLPLNRLERSKYHFCSSACANAFQARNKVHLTCASCSALFSVSRSEIDKAEKRGHRVQYCSIACRNYDKTNMTAKAQALNLVQLHRKGLNKLELAGRQWLEGLGYRRNADFLEQHLLFQKFCVDVFFPREKLVVQFDGEYWHTKPKRAQLDKSQDDYLKTCGLTVFRITDREMYSKDPATFQTIITRFLNSLLNACTQAA